MKSDIVTLPDLIRYALRVKGITPGVAAKQLGISKSYMSDYLSGRRKLTEHAIDERFGKWFAEVGVDRDALYIVARIIPDWVVITHDSLDRLRYAFRRLRGERNDFWTSMKLRADEPGSTTEQIASNRKS